MSPWICIKMPTSISRNHSDTEPLSFKEEQMTCDTQRTAPVNIFDATGWIFLSPVWLTNRVKRHHGLISLRYLIWKGVLQKYKPYVLKAES